MSILNKFTFIQRLLIFIAISVISIAIVTALSIFVLTKLVPKQSTNQASTLNQTASDQTSGSGLAISYPKTWSLSHQDADATGKADISTITSPDNKITITLKAGIAKPNGTCDLSNSNLQFDQNDTLSDFKDHTLTAYVNKNKDKTYSYYVGILRNSDLNYRGGCSSDSFAISVAKASPFKSGLTYQLASLTLTFNDIKNNDSTTFTSFNSSIQNENYSIAKQIMQSLRAN